MIGASVRETARVVAVLMVLAAGSAARAQNVVTADQARALIAEQRQFVTQMARGEVTGDQYTVRWTVNVEDYSDGHGVTFLSPDDVTHYTQTRQLAAGAKFLSYVDTAKVPGMRQALDTAFAAFLAQETNTGIGTDPSAYLKNVAKPAKDAEMKRILDLLGQLDLALDQIAAQAQIPDRTAGIGSTSGASSSGGAPPATSGTPAAPATAANGPALLGVGSQGGPAAPLASAPVPPAVPAGAPAGPGYTIPGLQPGQAPGQLPIGGAVPPLFPGFPGGGSIVIVIQGDPYSIAQILNLLIPILQAMALPPRLPAGPSLGYAPSPNPYALEQSLYGTGGLVDQSSRAMGLRPGVIPLDLALTVRVR